MFRYCMFENDSRTDILRIKFVKCDPDIPEEAWRTTVDATTVVERVADEDLVATAAEEELIALTWHVFEV